MSRNVMRQQKSSASGSDESVSRARSSPAEIKDGEPDIIAAIDIGSTFSGYAFGLASELAEDRANIYVNNNWLSGNSKLTTVKTPTTVLFTPEKRFHSFGYEAEWKYSQLTADKVNAGWFYFRRFKMSFLSDENLSTASTIEDDTGKSLRSAQVLGAVLKAMKGHLIDALAAIMKGSSVTWILQNFHIRWVLPHPVNFTEDAINLVRMAARQASINDPYLVPEPEVASMYCQVTTLHRINTRNGEITCVRPGLQYLLVDIGGGTVDTTIYSFNEDNTLQSLHSTCGAVVGGLRVDGLFVEFLMKVIGFEVMDKFAQNFRGDLLCMQKEFETKKRSFDARQKEPVIIKLPAILRKIYEVNAKQPIAAKVNHSEYGDLVRMQGDAISMDVEIFRGFIQTTGEAIVAHVSKVLSTRAGKDINTMVMTGGFSRCPVLQILFRRKFPSLTILMPDEPEVATMKGAVLYGFELKPIVDIRCRFTYGISMAMPYNRDHHPPEKRFQSHNISLCTDVFGLHLRKGETICVGELFSRQLLYVNRPKQRCFSVPVFLSVQDEPTFVSDKGCFYLGRTQIHLSPDRDPQAPIVVRMGLTYSELIVEVTDESTGLKVKDTFNDRPMK